MPVQSIIQSNHFIPFQTCIEEYALPERFTFPFCYEPHPLSILAANELQAYIQTQNDWQHNFGLEGDKNGIGKMFGVLVVQNADNELGYLAAFSGKLAGGNHHERFVPPVFDILEDQGFFKLEEQNINTINRAIEKLENAEAFIELKAQLHKAEQQAKEETEQLKQQLKEAKTARDIRRQEAQTSLSPTNFDDLQVVLNNESVYLYFQLKDLAKIWKWRLSEIQQQLDVYQAEINALKAERKNKSSLLQRQLFDNYTFLNQYGETKSLCDIFPLSDNMVPPAGAGECAAPKLLQYAFLHQLKPIAMAEFWWGQSPNSEIRKHAHFYSACISKCEPILTHMLEGIKMDINPMSINTALGQSFETIYEDDYLLVINKPFDFLSVPGKKVGDSIYSRIKEKYPESTGPLIVHRLDMSTSGLMLIAKTKEVHQHLQSQFIKRKIKKRYTALLDGIVLQDEGLIDLPLRVDLDDRPRQLVCYDYGKPAQTLWKVVERLTNQTKIHFFPITGRTHQLRVHASHPLGLNMPIIGDDLYGKRANRLYLHAESLEFMHPHSFEVMTVEAPCAF